MTGLQAVEAELRDHLAARGVPRLADTRQDAYDPAHVVTVGAVKPDEADVERRARAWQRDLWDAGLAWLEGPVDLGGRGLPPGSARRLQHVLDEYAVPDLSLYTVAHRIVAPTIAAHGTTEQQREWLPGIWSGDIVCCQLFSEPGAGSDLAGLRTSARRDGDDWVVSGQKVWSSGAHLSAVGELLVRTGSREDRHLGITALLLPMDTPGVTVRPIRQMNGGAHFCEVFLDDVRVPDSLRLGEVGQGWQVAMSTLGAERTAMGARHRGFVDVPTRRLHDLAADLGRLDDVDTRSLLAESWVREQVAAAFARRLADGADDLHPSVAKLRSIADIDFLQRAGAALLGPSLAVGLGTDAAFAWSQVLLTAPSQRLAGGTDEIQRNIVAGRVLGLPLQPNRLPRREDSRP